jgi:predicted Holliday junction resolvase-like endonuclease
MILDLIWAIVLLLILAMTLGTILYCVRCVEKERTNRVELDFGKQIQQEETKRLVARAELERQENLRAAHTNTAIELDIRRRELELPRRGTTEV